MGGICAATQKRIALIPAALRGGIAGRAKLCIKIDILVTLASADVMPHPHNLACGRLGVTTLMPPSPLLHEPDEGEEQHQRTDYRSKDRANNDTGTVGVG